MDGGDGDVLRSRDWMAGTLSKEQGSRAAGGVSTAHSAGRIISANNTRDVAGAYRFETKEPTPIRANPPLWKLVIAQRAVRPEDRGQEGECPTRSSNVAREGVTGSPQRCKSAREGIAEKIAAYGRDRGRRQEASQQSGVKRTVCYRVVNERLP